MNPASENSSGMDPEEEAWIDRALRGDHRAFGCLVERYEARLFRFVLERLGNREDAEDVLQLTFLAAYRQLGRYQRGRRFSTWLFTIAHRRAVDSRRRRVEPAGDSAEVTASGSHPAESIQAKEERGRLWALARRVLPDRQHAVLWLRYGEDMTIAEIATVTGLTRTHVKVLLHRARKTLGGFLDRGEVVLEWAEKPAPDSGDAPIWLRNTLKETP